MAFTTAAIIATALGAAAGAGIASASGAFGSDKSQASPGLQIPGIESASDTINKSKDQAQAATQARLKAARGSRSIYSSPLGIAGEAGTVKKVLLGQ